MASVQFYPVFTDDEQKQFLEKQGWMIEEREQTIWVQTGPYDRVGEYETRTKYYAHKEGEMSEEMDRVFRREMELKFKIFMIN
jgi:hypothetical protein